VKLNDQIVRVAKTLPADSHHRYGFSCERGCGEVIQLTLTEYKKHGAWIDGHRQA
jgi:hypothetical protein